MGFPGVGLFKGTLCVRLVPGLAAALLWRQPVQFRFVDDTLWSGNDGVTSPKPCSPSCFPPSCPECACSLKPHTQTHLGELWAGSDIHYHTSGGFSHLSETQYEISDRNFKDTRTPRSNCVYVRARDRVCFTALLQQRQACLTAVTCGGTTSGAAGM